MPKLQEILHLFFLQHPSPGSDLFISAHFAIGFSVVN